MLGGSKHPLPSPPEPMVGNSSRQKYINSPAAPPPVVWFGMVRHGFGVEIWCTVAVIGDLGPELQSLAYTRKSNDSDQCRAAKCCMRSTLGMFCADSRDDWMILGMSWHDSSHVLA